MMTMEMLKILVVQLLPLFHFLSILLLPAFFLAFCGGDDASASRTSKMTHEERKRKKEEDRKWREKGAMSVTPKGTPKAPEFRGKVADTHDPNYQTLAGLNDDVFEKKTPGAGATTPTAVPSGAISGAGIKAPQKGGMAATNEPNYQTLAGLSNDVFSAPRKGPTKAPTVKPTVSKPPVTGQSTPGNPAIKPPTKGGKAATHDPNYQTLAGVNDCFQAPKTNNCQSTPRAPAIKPPTKGGKVSTFDPNYQTLAGVNDCFQGNQSTPKNPAIKPPTKGGKVATTDPNYQTLAGINDDVFSKK